MWLQSPQPPAEYWTGVHNWARGFAVYLGTTNRTNSDGHEKAQEDKRVGNFFALGRECGMEAELKAKQMCDFVRETAFAIHKYFRNGHLEKVYENALAHRLRKAGLHVEQQWPLKVFDEDGTPVGEYYADLFVNGFLVVELKASRSIVDEHVAQVLGYLRASRKEHGLLINFGAKAFFIKKFVLSDERFC
jgi:GxxExxY protein